MAPAAPSSRPIVIKAQRDTIILVATATIVTFALASTIHARHPALGDTARRAEPPSQQAWAGDLATATPATATATGEPLTSASLVVARSELALPSMNVRPLVKLKGCEGSVCAAKPNAATPSRRASVQAAETPLRRSAALHRDKPDLIARFNPLTHLPDMSTIGKPFVFAGDAVSGWFKRF